MSYFLYKLAFDTPVHFGNAEQGGKLEQIHMDFPADTLFSAICTELAQHGETETLQWLIENVNRDSIVLSNLFPYLADERQDFLYIPKPLMAVQPENLKDNIPLEELKRMATNRKKQKKINYIRCGSLARYFKSLHTGGSFDENAEFGTASLTQRVSRREELPLPYYVAKYVFSDNAGMYMVVQFQDEAYAERFKKLLALLGLSGIGGKRSSGFGKFHVAGAVKLDEYCQGDELELYRLLENRAAGWQMNLSGILPAVDDLPSVKEGQYKLQKRSGFISVTNGEQEMKKNSIYFLAAGSCFKKRIAGRLAVLGNAGGHDILRYGKGLYVGLTLS